jgi:hypothetical protein
MLNAAFALLVISRQPITFATTVEFLRRWFLSTETPTAISELVHRLNHQGGSQNALLANALEQVNLWQNLDPRKAPFASRLNAKHFRMNKFASFKTLPESSQF